jgi:hypothetical protein
MKISARTRIVLGLGMLVLVTGGAVAGAITWEFKGEVISVTRSAPGVFSDVALSQEISGVFTYDADLADSFPDSTDADYFDMPVAAFAWAFEVGSTREGSGNGVAEAANLRLGDNEVDILPFTRDRFGFFGATNRARLSIGLSDVMLDPAEGQPDAIDGLTGSPPRTIALDRFNCNGNSFTRINGETGSCASFATLRDPDTGDQIGGVGFRITELVLASGRPYISSISIADINHNGTPELAILQGLSDDWSQVVIKDSDTKELINTVHFGPANDEPVGLTSILDMNGNGTPELAVLFVRDDGKGRVVIRDSVTAEWINQIPFFGRKWEVISISSQDSDLDGVSEISVMAITDDGTRAAVQLKDALTGDSVNWLGLPVE